MKEKIWDFLSNATDIIGGIILSSILVVSLFGIVGGFIFCGWLLLSSPQDKEARRQAEIAEATPHVYAQVDGCAVYTWYANGRNHYFTKCPTKVTTESWHDERSGKTRKQVSETIETER